MVVNVELRRGKHGRMGLKQGELTEMAEMIGRTLKAGGFRSAEPVVADLGQKIPGNHATKGVKIPPTGNQGYSIKMQVQVGDNGTRHEIIVKLPGGKESVAKVFNRLINLSDEALASVVAKPPKKQEKEREVVAVVARPQPAQPAPAAATEPAPEQPAQPAPEKVAVEAEKKTEQPAKKLDVTKYSTDPDLVLMLLQALWQAIKNGPPPDGPTCLRILHTEVGGGYSLRSFMALLEQLVRKEYVDRIGEQKDSRYRLSRKGLELIGFAPEAPGITVEEPKVQLRDAKRDIRQQAFELTEQILGFKSEITALTELLESEMTEEQAVSQQLEAMAVEEAELRQRLEKINKEAIVLKQRVEALCDIQRGQKKKIEELSAKREEAARELHSIL